MISRLFRIRAFRLAAYAAGAVAVAGSAVWVVAAATSPTPSPSSSTTTTPPHKSAGTSAVCTDFINHFSADLGTDQTKVDAAFQQALAETLADQVKAGKLTQPQADAIKAKLAGKQPCSIAPSLRAGGTAVTGAYLQQLLSAAASALGVTPDVLKADLQKGMSLSQIAAAQNPPVTEAQFRAKLIAGLKPLLDQAVASGKLNSAQEQKIIQRLQTGPIPFWDKAPKHSTVAGGPTPG